jgi:hypothetical protein
MKKHSSKTTTSDHQNREEGIFSTIRDTLYNIVFTEGDFALQLVGDLIGGTSRAREAKHLERQIHRQERRVHGNKADKHRTPTTAPLRYEERKVFQEIMQRHEGEEQVAYWKRKKRLLNHPNKQQLVAQELASRAQAEKQQTQLTEQEKAAEREKLRAHMAQNQRVFETVRKGLSQAGKKSRGQKR